MLPIKFKETTVYFCSIYRGSNVICITLCFTSKSLSLYAQNQALKHSQIHFYMPWRTYILSGNVGCFCFLRSSMNIMSAMRQINVIVFHDDKIH